MLSFYSAPCLGHYNLLYPKKYITVVITEYYMTQKEEILATMLKDAEVSWTYKFTNHLHFILMFAREHE